MFALKTTLTLAFVALLLAGNAAAQPAARPSEDVERSITLADSADLHAQLEPHAELFWHGGKDETAMAGGVARITSALEAIRPERRGKVLFMDAGDTIQGSAAAAWTEGRAVVAPVNALKLDLSVPGNWEVVYGAGPLAERAGEMFPERPGRTSFNNNRIACASQGHGPRIPSKAAS